MPLPPNTDEVANLPFTLSPEIKPAFITAELTATIPARIAALDAAARVWADSVDVTAADVLGFAVAFERYILTRELPK